jgi:hypothetical protein
MSREKDTPMARQGRRIALVIAGAMVLWLLLQEIGRQYGWPARYVFLFDFAAIAAMVWALIMTLRLWRARRDG